VVAPATFGKDKVSLAFTFVPDSPTSTTVSATLDTGSTFDNEKLEQILASRLAKTLPQGKFVNGNVVYVLPEGQDTGDFPTLSPQLKVTNYLDGSLGLSYDIAGSTA